MENTNNQPFDNKERNRYHGLRVGDIVDVNSVGGIIWGRSEILGLNPMDNNSVYIRSKHGKTISWVAEFCEIVTKVEDIKQVLKTPNAQPTPQPTTQTIIDILTDEMQETEVIFGSLLPVNLKGNFCLMKIAAVSVDANLRLWIKNDRGNWTELHEGLIYCEFICTALYQVLKRVIRPVVIVDQVNDTRVLIVDQIK